MLSTEQGDSDEQLLRKADSAFSMLSEVVRGLGHGHHSLTNSKKAHLQLSWKKAYSCRLTACQRSVEAMKPQSLVS